ncbi:MAG: archaeal proteasome endopeptidase complex subunit alpha, partial [Candidatus Diapherotrites archaeon]|nr:archaeal proteasome endopeptidase complex subunit alpha [Candidatus Diapherotrites archaeon]
KRGKRQRGVFLYPVSKRSSAYDRVATMFSPDGRLYQVEYASKIVEQGTLGAALVFDNGVLLGADKKVTSRLILPESIEKIFKVDNHIGVISSGLVGDARRLVQLARKDAQENVMYYDEKISVETLAKQVSATKQLFTQYAGMRPFGVSFIIGGKDDSGARLFETEPSGALAEYKAIAIGKGKKECMEYFEKKFEEKMSKDKALGVLLKGIEKGLAAEKQKVDLNRLDVAIISEVFERLPKEKLESALGKS